MKPRSSTEDSLLVEICERIETDRHRDKLIAIFSHRTVQNIAFNFVDMSDSPSCRSHISKTTRPNNTVFSVHVKIDTAVLFTSGLVDGVVFSRIWPGISEANRVYTQRLTGGSTGDKV